MTETTSDSYTSKADHMGRFLARDCQRFACPECGQVVCTHPSDPHVLVETICVPCDEPMKEVDGS